MANRRAVLFGAETALLALTIVVTISLERLFTDTSYLRDLVLVVVGAHVVASVCRRAELSMLWSTVVSALALVVVGTAVFYSDVASLVVPTRETLTVLADDLRDARQVFSEDAAPVPPIRGFVVATAVLIWWGAFLADWAAFRLRSPLEAVAPATAVFVFASLLGVDRNEIAHGLLFSLGLLAVLLTMRAARQVREETWVAGGAVDGVRTTLRLGVVAGGIAVLLASLVAPRLPGATAQPLVDITEINNGPETRSVLSPLVEVSATLVHQTDVELFSVKVDPDDRDYWRLMALTTFDSGGDGRPQMWRRSSNFDEARGSVDSSVDASVLSRGVVQEITVANLGNIYLPAAYEVSNVLDSGDINLEYEVATGALVIERGIENIPRGFTYEIESQVPDYSPTDLPADATAGLSGDFIREHTELPDDCAPGEDADDTGCWPTEITAEAERVVNEAGATTDHARALALQNYFLDPTQFTYDLNVALNHDIGDMTEFLEVGVGYCEQFASTYAAMARSLGLPARVAVGFTWGEWDATRGEYVVKGKHAHAWPEVYFADVGWVVFDPTPGRSRGFDGDITGLVTPEQVGAVDQGPPSTLDPASPTSTVVPGPQDPTNSAVRPTIPTGDPETVAGGPAAPTASNRGPWIALAVVGGILALVGFVPLVQWIRRRRRISRVAGDPVGQGELAWDEALSALRLLGFSKRSDQTPHEFAAAVDRSRRGAGPIRQLAHEVTRLRYATTDPRDPDTIATAIRAQEAGAEIVRECRTQAGPTSVVKEVLDPRGLWRATTVSILSR